MDNEYLEAPDNTCQIAMIEIKRGALVPDDIEDYSLYLMVDGSRFLTFDGENGILERDEANDIIEPLRARVDFIAIEVDDDGRALLAYEVESIGRYDVFEGFESHILGLWQKHGTTPFSVHQDARIETEHCDGHEVARYYVFSGFSEITQRSKGAMNDE